MAKETKSPVPAGKEASKKGGDVTPGWEKKVYSPERMQGFLNGELSLADLHVISPGEMMEMAMVGYQFFEQGRYSQARTVFQGLNALDPDEAYYLTALGAVLLAEDNLEQAERVLNGAIQLDPNEIATYVNRGEVYLRQDRIVEAAHDFKRAVELDPEDKDPLSHRARLLAAAAVETIRAAQRQSSSGGKTKPAPPVKGASTTVLGSKPGSPLKKK